MTRKEASTLRVLLLEQGFMKPRRGKPIHGVELFRLNLIRDLASMGVRFVIPCEPWWAGQIRERVPSEHVEVIEIPRILRVAGTGWLAARAGRRLRPFDLVLFGDPGAGMIPAMRAACRAKLAPRFLSFCHRLPKARTVRAMAMLPIEAVVNSDLVATPFREGGIKTQVMYGVPEGELFHPLKEPRPADGVVNFVLVARLPGHDKGHDLAIEAMSHLPEDVRDRCRLHLAAYQDLPAFDDSRIKPYPWMALEEVGDLLRTMDVQLAISSHETFSQAIVQGMLSELAIIATPIPVYLDKVDPARGGGGAIILSDRFPSPQELAEAMAQLARDSELKRTLGCEARRIALERFVWDSRRFLDEVLNSKSDA